MKKKPIVIIVVAAFFLISPFVIILQTSLLTNTPVIGPYNITAKLSLSDWIILALYLVCAVSVFSVRKWGWYVFILSSLYLIGSNLAVFFFRPNYGAAVLILSNLVLAVGAGVFFRRAVIAAYFNPRIRWWEQATRLRINVYAEIGPARTTAEILDVSASGAYIAGTENLVVGSPCAVTLHCLSHTVRLESVVMSDTRRGKETGYGLRFVNTGRIEKDGLNHILRDLARAGAVDRERQGPVRLTKLLFNKPRFRLPSRVRFQTATGSCGAILLDLSRGGCLIQPTDACLPPLNEPCLLTIGCLDTDLTLNGIPRWSGAPEGNPVTGIAFSFKNRSEKARLRALRAACRRGHAPNRLVSATPLSADALLASALRSPYRFVYSLIRKLKRERAPEQPARRELSKKILLVDDDREFTAELADVIKEEGFAVDTAGSGPEGESLISSRPYVAAVIDFRIPGFDGIELLKRIEAKSLPLKIIFISGTLNIQKIINEKRVGHVVARTMQKPFGVEKLIENLKEITG